MNFILSNEGSSITSITASSSNQNVVDDADISLNNSGSGVYEIVISNLSNNEVGEAQITITANDGIFDYSGTFNLTTTSIDITVLATETSICAGEAVTLLALGAGNISWDNGIENNVEFTPETTAIYTVTGDDGSGCAASESIEIEVNPVPAIPTITPFSTNLVSSAANGNQWYLEGELIEGATSQLYAPMVTGNYSVIVSQGACSSVSEPYFYEGLVTSIFDAKNAIELYPNPASDYISIKGLEYGSLVSLNSITGTQISTVSSLGNSLTMSISELPAGVYLITVSQSQSAKTLKLVIQ